MRCQAEPKSGQQEWTVWDRQRQEGELIRVGIPIIVCVISE